jgi:hypothetical protein
MTEPTPENDQSTGEMLILPDGKILAHNISPVLAGMLSALNPADETMKRRANPKNEIPGRP